MILPLLQTDSLSEAAQAIATPVQQPTQMNESLWSMFNMGGPLMWVLLALSFLAI